MVFFKIALEENFSSIIFRFSNDLWHLLLISSVFQEEFPYSEEIFFGTY